MPRPSLLPTPAVSTEIQGKDGSPCAATEKSFELGPPAITSKQASGVSPRVKQPQSCQNVNFTLPPPPTRSRTIIQMKPKPQQSEDSKTAPAQRISKGSVKKATSGSGMNNGGGKKQPSSTSVAGKKIARKTAHSVIERRRRSKMNEEFATLKGMIPACTDQEMHKLAILQASIDYLRYLEQCITDLKAANNSLSTPLIQPRAPPPRLNDNMFAGNDVDQDQDEDEDEDEDEEVNEDTAMENTDPSSIHSSAYPTAESQVSSYRSPQSITESPALDGQPQYQTSSYASSLSTLPSPAFGPQMHGSQFKFLSSASTSPTIMPSPEQDQEATAALLMLNTDRRHPKGGRGMSVKDLLSF